MPYDKDLKFHCSDESRTQQHMSDDCNINTIMRRWRKNEQPRHVNPQQPSYGDFSNVGDYMSALNQVEQAETDFMALDSEVRKACQNNPAEFIRLCQDPSQLDFLRDKGLAEPQVPSPPAAPAPAPQIDPPAAPPPQESGGSTGGSA